MKNLLSKDGIRALEAFCMAKPLFGFDFDGTLAPIVDIPAAAAMRSRTRALVEGIIELAPVALISGRAKSDLQSTMGLRRRPAYVIGNHGLEGIPGGSDALKSAEVSCRAWDKALNPKITLDGVSIENKRYSLAVHYRFADSKRAAKLAILAAAQSLKPKPRIVLGKCVVNIMSPGSPHKGLALIEVMRQTGCSSGIYFGDDDNDEDVFALDDEGLLTVCIGRRRDSSALFYLESQNDIDSALTICRRALLESGKRPRRNPRGINAS